MTVATIIAGRKARQRKRTTVTTGLGLGVVALFCLSLMIGDSFYGPDEVIRVILGEQVPRASFTVGELRFPRAAVALLTGLCFGMSGVTFQTMLRNPLASPDIVGVSAGASAAAVVGIIGFTLSDTMVSLLALGGALTTAALMNVLANKGGFAGSRLILIGIGLAAMLRSVVAYMLSLAASWDLQSAMRWLTGSLNGATWERAAPLATVTILCGAGLIFGERKLGILRLGDDSAEALGVKVNRTRLTLMLGAVVLLAFATAAAGPIAFVAFMAGPIAVRLVGSGGSLLVPSALVGAVLVMGADLVGQFAFEHRYPVGVITGVLGAPYLIILLIRTNRSGASL